MTAGSLSARPDTGGLPVAGAVPTAGPGRRPVWAQVAAPVAVLVIALGCFGWQWEQPRARTGTGDSYWYLLSAAGFAGADADQAARQAGQVSCAEWRRVHPAVQATSPTGHQVGCDTGIRPDRSVSPRYRAIFTSRPGYPLVAAPLVAVFGLALGIAVATGGLFVLVALLTYAGLRLCPLDRFASVVGASAVCLLPTGYWDSRMLAEGAAQAGVLAVVLAALLLLRRPSGLALALLATALTWSFLTKPAEAAALCVTLVGAAVPGVLVTRRQPLRRRRWLHAAAVSAGVAAGWWMIGDLLHLPSLLDTVQDMATRHFRSPDIAHPLQYLLRRTGSLWWHLPRWAGLPWPLALTASSCVVLVRTIHGRGLVWSAAALSGVLVVCAHPLASEYPRLIATTWFAVAAALAVLTQAVVHRLPRAGVDR